MHCGIINFPLSLDTNILTMDAFRKHSARRSYSKNYSCAVRLLLTMYQPHRLLLHHHLRSRSIANPENHGGGGYSWASGKILLLTYVFNKNLLIFFSHVLHFLSFEKRTGSWKTLSTSLMSQVSMTRFQ